MQKRRRSTTDPVDLMDPVVRQVAHQAATVQVDLPAAGTKVTDPPGRQAPRVLTVPAVLQAHPAVTGPVVHPAGPIRRMAQAGLQARPAAMAQAAAAAHPEL